MKTLPTTFSLALLLVFLVACQAAPASTPTVTPQSTTTLTSSPTPFRIIMLSEFQSKRSPDECAANSIHFPSPTFQEDVQAAYASILAQSQDANRNLVLRFVDPSGSPGNMSDFEPVFPFYLESAVGNIPIVACGELTDGTNTARIMYLLFPLPTVDEGNELMPIGIVTEHAAELTYNQAVGETRYSDHGTDARIYRTVKEGTSLIRLDLFIDIGASATVRAIRAQKAEEYGFHFVLKLFDHNEELLFTQYLIEVFYRNNLTHLSELKRIFQTSLFPGLFFNQDR